MHCEVKINEANNIRESNTTTDSGCCKGQSTGESCDM